MSEQDSAREAPSGWAAFFAEERERDGGTLDLAALRRAFAAGQRSRDEEVNDIMAELAMVRAVRAAEQDHAVALVRAECDFWRERAEAAERENRQSRGEVEELDRMPGVVDRWIASAHEDRVMAIVEDGSVADVVANEICALRAKIDDLQLALNHREGLAGALAACADERDELRAENERMRAVVEAARSWRERNFATTPSECRLVAALDALDREEVSRA